MEYFRKRGAESTTFNSTDQRSVSICAKPSSRILFPLPRAVSTERTLRQDWEEGEERIPRSRQGIVSDVLAIESEPSLVRVRFSFQPSTTHWLELITADTLISLSSDEEGNCLRL
jgi:hypothetical protein